MSSLATIKYPLNRKKNYFETTEDSFEIVKEQIKQILLTNNNDRVIRRGEFGVPLHSLFFENDVDEAIQLLKTYLQEQCKKYISDTLEITNIIKQDTTGNALELQIDFKDTELLLNGSIILKNN